MEKRDDKPVQIVQRTDHEHKSLEVSMLEKDDFSDEELESYLSKGEIKATDKVTIPPKILFVGDCTIATFGNFSASTGKAKSKKTFNISAMEQLRLQIRQYSITGHVFLRGNGRSSILIQNRANIIVIMFWSEFISFRGFLLRRMTHAFCFGACVSTHRNLESLSLIMPCVNTKRLDL